MFWIEALSLCFAACLAGLMNAVAGGGTLVTFPTLLFFGAPGIVANATSTLALVVGTGGSIYGYRRLVSSVRPWLMRFVPVSLAGGLLGSILLTRTSERMFSQLVPYLLLFATVLFLSQGLFRRWGLQHPGKARPRAWVVAVLFQFAVAVYGGYFGAGIGILMLASLGFMGFEDLHQMNALKNVLGSLINLVAAVWFVGSGLIDWPKMAVMTGGAVVGYYLGAHYSQRFSQAQMRGLVAVVGFGISLKLFYDQWAAA
jgi:uncharacterized membrane protein YfcA